MALPLVGEVSTDAFDSFNAFPFFFFFLFHLVRRPLSVYIYGGTIKESSNDSTILLEKLRLRSRLVRIRIRDRFFKRWKRETRVMCRRKPVSITVVDHFRPFDEA